MANKKRGEVKIEALGQTMTMRFGTNQICSLEDDLDLGINEIAERLSNPSKMRVSLVRKVLMHSLNSPGDISITLAGEIIDELGIETIGDKLGEAFQAAFPDAEDDQDPPAKAG